jgi:hypothetical protein
MMTPPQLYVVHNGLTPDPLSIGENQGRQDTDEV